MERRAFLAGTGCGVAALCAGCVTGTPLSPDVTAAESRTYDVEDGTTLSVRNRNGPVTVAGHDGDAVAVRIEKSARRQETLDAAEVSPSRSDGSFRLETVHDGADDSRATVSLTVDCPDGVRVGRIETDNGAVDLTDVTGDVTVAAENGAVRATNVAGTVSVSTSNGSVEASDIEAIGDVKTSNGSVDVEVPAITGDTEIATEQGAIEAALAPDLDAAVTAETTNGAVEVSGPEFSSGESSGTSFSGTLGAGTHALAFETTNGAVELTALSE